MSWFASIAPFLSQTDATAAALTLNRRSSSVIAAFSVREEATTTDAETDELEMPSVPGTAAAAAGTGGSHPGRRMSQRTKASIYAGTDDAYKEADEELPPLAAAQRKLLERTLPDKSRSSTLSWLMKDENMPPKEDVHARCEWMVSRAASSGDAYDLAFRYLPLYGCPFGRENIMCMPCSGQIHGGYIPGIGVLICENHVDNSATLTRTLTHELIHAFDECRAKIDWTNCEHQACTEIRAATLSGDCDMKAEARRGVPPSQGGFRACVRRRAILSVQANPNCRGKRAEEAVDRVWNPCHYDVAPFPELSHSDRQAFKNEKST